MCRRSDRLEGRVLDRRPSRLLDRQRRRGGDGADAGFPLVPSKRAQLGRSGREARDGQHPGERGASETMPCRMGVTAAGAAAVLPQLLPGMAGSPPLRSGDRWASPSSFGRPCFSGTAWASPLASTTSALRFNHRRHISSLSLAVDPGPPSNDHGMQYTMTMLYFSGATPSAMTLVKLRPRGRADEPERAMSSG